LHLYLWYGIVLDMDRHVIIFWLAQCYMYIPRW